MAAYFASPLIRYRLIDGNVIILDLQTGEYKFLDEVATAMWEMVLGDLNHERAIDSLAQRFNIARERISADLKAFVSEAEQGGLLNARPYAPIALHGRVRWPESWLAAGAWWSLFTTTRIVARKGFAHAYSQLAVRAKPPIDDKVFAARLADATRAFSLAENFFLIRSAPRDCLPRSLSLYRFLLMAGIPADHVIGVRRFPFHAHAWVECAGRVLFDSRDLVHSYAELARM